MESGKYCQDRKDDADAPRTSKFFGSQTGNNHQRVFFLSSVLLQECGR